VLYLPGGLASLRWETFRGWWRETKEWGRLRRYEWSGEKARDKQRARERRRV
jgi:branched-chain amino acid transport system permease protein